MQNVEVTKATHFHQDCDQLSLFLHYTYFVKEPHTLESILFQVFFSKIKCPKKVRSYQYTYENKISNNRMSTTNHTETCILNIHFPVLIHDVSIKYIKMFNAKGSYC